MRNMNNEEERAMETLVIAAAGDHIVEVQECFGAQGVALAKAMNEWKGTAEDEEGKETQAKKTGQTSRPARNSHWSSSRRRMLGEWIENGECALAHTGTLIIEEWEKMEKRTLEEVIRAANEGSVCAHRSRSGVQETKVRKAQMTLVLASARPPRKEDPRYRDIRRHTIAAVKCPTIETLEENAKNDEVEKARNRALQLDGILPARLDGKTCKALRAQMDTEAQETLESAGDAQKQNAVIKIARTMTHLNAGEKTTKGDIEHALTLSEV